MRERGNETQYVPYRDSKLTSLLKQSIGGNSFCLMVACLAPTDAYTEENLSTLNYATKASHVANEPIRNVDPKTRAMRELKHEVSALKKELAEAYKHIDILNNVIGQNRNLDLFTNRKPRVLTFVPLTSQKANIQNLLGR